MWRTMCLDRNDVGGIDEGCAARCGIRKKPKKDSKK